MTLNEFNSKIHLPSLFESVGHKDFQFIKIPLFGWMAYKTKQDCTDIFTIHNKEIRPELFRHFVLHKPEFHESKIFYSEISEQRFLDNFHWLTRWRTLHRLAQEQMENGSVKLPMGRVKIRKVLEELGLPHLVTNEVGVYTELLHTKTEEAKILQIKPHNIGKLIVPSFYAPGRACSYDFVDPHDLNNREKGYVNGERGWMGSLNTKVAAGLAELGFAKGFTWDKKADFWNTNIVELSTQLSPEQLLTIWSESRNTVFDKNPLDLLPPATASVELTKYLKKLNSYQVKELEKKFKINLLPTWQQEQEQHIYLGNYQFKSNHSRYYLLIGNSTQEFTNFTLKLTRITKEHGEFIREGVISYNGEEFFFKLPQKAFKTSYTLFNALTKLFLEMAIGIPVVLPNYRSYLLDVIHRFNPKVEILTS